MKTIEQYEDEFSGLESSAVCNCCGEFKVQPENVWFDEQGYGYSTRLTKCEHCGKIIILEFIQDYGLDVNSDNRFYTYR